MREKESADLCKGCSHCCEYITVIIETPKTEAQKDRIRWYLLHKVFVFVTDKGVWKVHMPVKCSALDSKGRCSSYSSRPNVCREHSSSDCERHGKSEKSVTVFASVESFDKYLKLNRHGK